MISLFLPSLKRGKPKEIFLMIINLKSIAVLLSLCAVFTASACSDAKNKTDSSDIDLVLSEEKVDTDTESSQISALSEDWDVDLPKPTFDDPQFANRDDKNKRSIKDAVMDEGGLSLFESYYYSEGATTTVFFDNNNDDILCITYILDNTYTISSDELKVVRQYYDAYFSQKIPAQIRKIMSDDNLRDCHFRVNIFTDGGTFIYEATFSKNGKVS